MVFDPLLADTWPDWQNQLVKSPISKSILGGHNPVCALLPVIVLTRISTQIKYFGNRDNINGGIEGEFIQKIPNPLRIYTLLDN